MLAKILLRLFGANRRGTAANAVKKSWTSAKGSGTNSNGTDTNTVKKLVQWIQICYPLPGGDPNVTDTNGSKICGPLRVEIPV